MAGEAFFLSLSLSLFLSQQTVWIEQSLPAKAQFGLAKAPLIGQLSP